MANRYSFRDPSGFLLLTEEQVLRFVYDSGVPDLELFLKSSIAQKLMETGTVVSSRILDRDEFVKSPKYDLLRNFPGESQAAMIVEHERLTFASFPYEWSPAMLFAAAELTLDIAENLLNEGLGLKDATPFNVLFRGPDPVFVDLLSFEARAASDPTWMPHAQFMRTFFFPILVNAHFGVPLDQLFLTRRDGIEPEEVYRLCSFMQKLLPLFLFHVSIPVWLAMRQQSFGNDIYRKRELNDPEKSRFILESLFCSLRKGLARIAPDLSKRSDWSSYMESNSYSQEHFKAKNDFVANALETASPALVLDVGCNTGYFSVLAAKCGARVTAIDYDPILIDHVWHKAREHKLDILPLVVNLGRPSPAVGWLNREYPSFIERATGAFDAVIMLAVLHHVLVTDQIPLDDIINLAAELTTDVLIIEFVSPEDAMFKRIVRGRDHLYLNLTVEVFKESCSRHFDIVESMHVEGTQRWIYVMRKKTDAQSNNY